MHIAFYKANSPGLAGLYNRAVRWWTGGKYSHVELIFSNGLSASSSFRDGGVRFKTIDYDMAKWDIYPLHNVNEAAALQWFQQHQGAPYDIVGNLHFLFNPIAGSVKKWFCSEAAAAALGVNEPWRCDPNSLHWLLQQMGFMTLNDKATEWAMKTDY